MQFSFVTLAVIAVIGIVSADYAAPYGHHGYDNHGYDKHSYGHHGYGHNAVYAPENAEAAAAAVTDIAAAKASAAKIDEVNFHAVHNYGHQIGVPLLVRPYGPLTPLYSALAPKRSFVGTIDSGFYKDSYGKVKFRDETAVGAIAI
ncbi:chorion protein 16 [Haematobia irritans]|uniref:chorion protein 16 n=1 Tax=Haematobia irritans TaxID=7368 RepID=UPI003F4F74C2